MAKRTVEPETTMRENHGTGEPGKQN
jgi:hypothetical protein